ncbi:MAG: glycoside hydrolase family 2 TIM barrel-domain containing protein [Prevotella sp.]|nr:glycoside hydrolase family 2 TIM barrel-domain containing protein [Prevotella sp.]
MRNRLLLFALSVAASAAAQRHETTLADGWAFSRDKAQWENVAVPHDWAISGPFDKKWDLQTVAIEQNGEKEKTEKSGRSGALPWIGEGHYRTTVTIPAGCSHAELVFDGAMSEPTVSVNGQRAGYWAYGYNAFKVDITPFVKAGDNLVEVDLKNVEESSRWYPGGGIYRPVKLITTGDARFETFETFAYTTRADKKTAEMKVSTKVAGNLKDGNIGVNIALYDQKGFIVAESHCGQTETGDIETVMNIKKPQLWSPESPYLYKLVTKLFRNNRLIDQQTTKVGIRTVTVTKDGGFQLNGQTRKLKGVCLHHDLGPLGAAVNKAALIRQIKMMKAMGCDAIRTAHNMPSTIQMDICDSLGMMVMAESFDMWKYAKCRNGYARFFDEWSGRDMENLVKNHRNHPSIIMWSIGNEIPEQGMKGGKEIARRLQDICHRLDPSRTVTQGMDRVDNAMKTGFAQVMDVPGFNYRVHKYEKGLKELPQGFLLGSETASTVSSRGVYKFPVEISNKKTYADGQCSGYDTEYCSWSNLPDDDWRWQDDYDKVIGEFVWTGYDYLGEPTPYDEYWPSRSSYFGICDLAGLPKDRYYLYRSKWNTKEHTVHLLPHWTWPERKGKVTPVYCYTDGVEGELFINGKSQGRVRKNRDGRLDRYRLRWNDVKYEPGEIRVVVFDESGNKIGEDSRRTAGAPAQLLLSAEYADDEAKTLKADGNDVAFVTVSLIDKDGNLCPTADDQLTFEVTGEGSYQAACNGDATSLEPFTQPQMKLFGGQLVVVVRSTKTAGTMTLKVTDAKRKLTQMIDIKSI